VSKGRPEDPNSNLDSATKTVFSDRFLFPTSHWAQRHPRDMKESHPSDETIFAAALELPAGERASYLEVACAGDAALRARIESLLRAQAEASRFMATPAFTPLAETRMQGVPLEKSGDVIGRYKLLQKLGEGGCGTVYM
jgi:hypothetical protein